MPKKFDALPAIGAKAVNVIDNGTTARATRRKREIQRVARGYLGGGDEHRLLVANPAPAHKRAVTDLFDIELRAKRRDRAARIGPELFLYERAFDDCLERIELAQRGFKNALLIGCPDAAWPQRLESLTARVEVRDPGPRFAERSNGRLILEEAWEPPAGAFDLIVAIGTLDTANDLPLALQLIRHAMEADGLFIGAVSGGDTLPQLRAAMRAADLESVGAAPHVHPRIEASALAPLLEQAGFARPVVDIDRVPVSYRSLDTLVGDLRAMGATNVLNARPRFVGRKAKAAGEHAFRDAGDGTRTVETFEILHFAAWTPSQR